MCLMLEHHCSANCSTKKKNYKKTKLRYLVSGNFQLSFHTVLCYIMRFNSSDSRNFLFTQRTASTFTRELIMSSSSHGSLDSLTSLLRLTFACISPSVVLFPPHHERPRSYLPNTETTKARCVSVLSLPLFHMLTPSHFISHTSSVCSSVSFNTIHWDKKERKTSHIHIYTLSLSLSNPDTDETPVLFCSVSVLKVNWPTGKMACSNLDNADLLRDGSELREMPYTHAHAHKHATHAHIHAKTHIVQDCTEHAAF